MRKLISVFFILVISFSALSGCGVKRPLYKTPEQQQKQKSRTDVESTPQQPQQQQEK